MSGRSEVVVVGGGLGGLAAATLIARARPSGRPVRLFERASRPGGLALSPKVGGEAMNLGPHALFRGGPAEALLRTLGVAWTGFSPTVAPLWLVDGHDVFASPRSVLSMLASPAFSWAERTSLLRFFATLDLTRPSAVTGLSARQWLDRHEPPGRARRFLEAMIRVGTYVNSVDGPPAELALHQLQTLLGIRARGVSYVDGGWQSLVDELEAQARRAGVEIVTGAACARVEAGASVVLASGERIDAEHVVVALPASGTALLTGAPLTGAPVRAACLDLLLTAPPSRRLVFGLDEPHYLSVHSPVDVTTNVRVHAMRYLAPGESGAEQRGALEAWVDRAAPGWRSLVAHRRFLPELEVISAAPRSTPEVPLLAGVSFVGDWTSARYALLDAVADSAVRAADAAAAAQAKDVARERVAA